MPTNRLAVGDVLLSGIPLLHPVLKPISDSLALEIIPAKFAPRTPEAIMGELLGASDPDSVSTRRAAQEAKVTKLKAILENIGPDEEFKAQRETFEASLTAAQALLSKLDKGTPTPGHDLKAYRKAKASYELSIQEKKDRQMAGVAKTQERRLARRKFLQDIRAQLDLLAVGVAKLDEDLDVKYQERGAARLEHEAKVLKAFEDKITALEVVPMIVGAALPQVAAPALPQAPVPPVTTLAVSTPVPVDQQPLDPGSISVDELPAVRQQLFEMTRRYEEAAGRYHSEFSAVHEDVNISSLPAAALPTPEEVGVYGMLLVFFDNWAVHGANEPFDWRTLASRQGPGPSVVKVIKTLVGDALWAMFYAVETPPPDGVLPRQLVGLAHHALRCLKIQFDGAEAEQNARKLALETIGEVKVQLKRLRTA